MAARAGLGRLLHRIRTDRGWTLQAMGERCGVPVSTLSKLENGKATLGYDRLEQLADRLGMSLAEFFGAAEAAAAPLARRSVCTPDQALHVRTGNYDYYYLCTDLRAKRMIPMMTAIRARTLAEFGPMSRHSGEEFFFVHKGTVELHTEFYAPVILRTGDSVYFDAAMGHAYLAHGCEEAVIVGTCSALRPGLETQLVTMARGAVRAAGADFPG